MNLQEKMTIKALKYGERLHYEWETLLLERTERHVIVLGEHGRRLRHYTKGRIFTIENWTIECFPTDAWFTVSADVINGEIARYYCNLCQPPRIKGRELAFVDLDIDLVFRDGEWKVVDEDEFAENAIKLAYPRELTARVREELAALQRRIETDSYPFDGTIERFVERVPKG